jgi:energy-coupling factor transporter ATP-binding protein EcfA2
MELRIACSLRSLTFEYDGDSALDIPALDIPAGQICFFTGPNGSGKTTLLSILALLRAPASGSVFLDGKECSREPARERRRMVTLVHQKPALFSSSVRNNLEYGLKARGLASGEIERRIEAIVEDLQLSSLIGNHARKLSGGEAQRVVLARAIVLETPILLLDEPTNSLDDAYRPSFVRMLHNINRERGTTIIAATHDTRFVEALPGRILRMEKGKILEDTDG